MDLGLEQGRALSSEGTGVEGQLVQSLGLAVLDFGRVALWLGRDAHESNSICAREPGDVNTMMMATK